MKWTKDGTMRYRSKIDWWFHLTIVLFALITGALFYGAVSPGGIQAQKSSYALCFLLFAAMFVFFLFPIYVSTYYAFEPGALYIHSGFTTRVRIPYYEILSWEPATRKAGSSAALSRDKILITYLKKDAAKTITVSPEDKFDFMTALKLAKKPKDETI